MSSRRQTSTSNIFQAKPRFLTSKNAAVEGGATGDDLFGFRRIP
jgi:hypothetical protein